MSEDGPSTSGVAPPRQPKAAWMNQLSDDDESKNDDDPLKTAWTDFTERISVAGWKEAFDEPIGWIRRQYKAIVIVFSLVCFYYIYLVIDQFANSGYADEITDFAELASLPMSNVTICAQVYFNQTFIRHNLTIPIEIWPKIAKFDNMPVDEFYRQLALYLGQISRPKGLHPLLAPFFEKVVRTNPHIRDYVNFAKAAWPKCEDTLRKCQFDGVEFACCRNAVMSFDDDGICFLIPMNMDSDNAYPSDSTKHQRVAGPDGGLTIETRLVVTDFPWLGNDAQNGFLVMVGHTPISVFKSPICVPHGSETYIKVIPEKHALASKCAPHGNLRFPSDRDHQYAYYDPEGECCGTTKVIESLAKVAHCHLTVYTYHPNASMACPPRVVNAFGTVMIDQNYKEAFFGTGGTEEIGISKERIGKFFADIEISMKETMNDKSRCPRHCEYWAYRSTASFNYLEGRDESTPVDYMFSRIHVYYGSLDYRQHQEVLEYAVYLAFCDFGNVVGLYWGMSIVSFFHVFYYVPRYVFVKRNVQQIQKSDQTVVQFNAGSKD